jgi:transketolase
MAEITKLKDICTQVRRDIVRMVHAVQSGHPGGSLGCTDYLVALYFEIMDVNPDQFSMDGIGEDLFVLSRKGYFPVAELGTFRKLDSRLQGHPATAEHTPGVRIASGSLGQGLSVACGAALSKKLNRDNKLVYVLHGDGELQEGQIWEAAMFAAHKKIDNLIATVDVNGQQIDGSTEQVMSLGDLEAKWKAFGWDVLQMNGNNLEEVVSVLKNAKGHTGKGKPVVILMKTEMGFGVDYMMGSHKWHGIAPNDELLQKALDQLPETLGDY